MIETRQAVERSTTSSPCPGSTPSTSARPTSRSPTGCRPASTTRATRSTARWPIVAAPCQRHGVVPGIHANPSLAGKRAAGFRMITVGIDLGNVMGGLRRDLASSREAVEGGEAP